MKSFNVYRLVDHAWELEGTVKRDGRKTVVHEYLAGHKEKNNGKIKVRLAS